MEVEQFHYDNKIVKKFTMATLFWGIVGMSVGLLLAFMFLFPNITDGIPWLSFGRLRPLHTNAVIFAFVGNAIFAGVYYSTQRLLKARMFSDFLSNFNFWGWQAIIVAAAITLPMGFTSSKEYAELEWPIDIAIALVWVAFGANLIGTMIKRRQRHLYVAIWFYLATFVTVAVLHIVNNIEIPVTALKSYSFYSGVQDALVQWWYGHNAVAFFLTTPFLGLMYYFVPKAANRPVYSYRLSIIHFWSLIFIYIWAGPHHLLYSTLPDWAQNLGVAFSVMLLFPSWGGMINGLLTLRGAWDKVRTDPVLKFFVVAITGYGMATFEGPMLSLKNVNAIAHFSDWIIAHVHVGALAWNGFLTFGMVYWLVPRLFKTKLYSIKLANVHFWIGTLGIIIYTLPMYVAGFVQASMWKQFNPDGTLTYGNFLETVSSIIPMYWMRAIGGSLYIVGAFILLYNIVKTVRQGSAVEDELAEAAPLQKVTRKRTAGEAYHSWLERRPVKLTIFATIAILIGGIVQIVPSLMVDEYVPVISSVKPYTPLELEGRDIYIREGCVSCHSQMIRPFRSEVERYGEYSKAGEYVYDYPFLWGSKRTGPDLMRVGGKYSDNWHLNHMYDPQSTSSGSIMPSYKWIVTDELDKSDTEAKMKALSTLGVPYTLEEIENAQQSMTEQGIQIEKNLYADPDFVDTYEAEKEFAAQNGNEFVEMRNREIVALIAYLQRLGTDIKAKDVEVTNTKTN
ncbi:cytochrome-c oxidase, cbb3-type subunit I [Salegentibacter mishustinae]|jgi:cytochrome c oxidase cbb3-type subunit I/II|uniref:cytochrome-c oxidase n=1 Tax=Salegentibacter mishustinae TaxID=270918 RepID=A0A0Q9Z3T0_9FLAO|nr:cytochrome-c oxidase, cbb3-type subunit I [Salegentibacter mishustinae]KRG27344.1 cytochrome C oxidase Cbb3 [Salegentibacter mishustinae]MDX1719177.1 cytochrome-c oxidase, cbb3-type subunit I [Salegentibacter mishustinae]PNW21578.1 cytochrome C oxidase Cbb3 [Salegentibacter mishustinae]PZX62468.1 cytochrome c oxidase cbb3-type subunit I/II [Salegentibacter mishustinae]GGW96067.1 bifunctional cbb3-type cytochrome C oxidase subunit I/II [Salegentibacter mishustinae]